MCLFCFVSFFVSKRININFIFLGLECTMFAGLHHSILTFCEASQYFKLAPSIMFVSFFADFCRVYLNEANICVFTTSTRNE